MTQAGQLQPASGLPISVVERETGIPKDLLRMWERRYGFPLPGRDAQGDRVYPRDQVDKLRTVRQQPFDHLLQAAAGLHIGLSGKPDGHRVGHHEQAQIDGFDFLRGDRRR